MASVPTFQSNPYADFDPSQWSNPYSNYAASALPWPSTYAGTPTNALGQPIQPPMGMTLNSSPMQPQAAAAPQGPTGYWGGGGQGTGGAAGGENAMGSGGTPGGQTAPRQWIPLPQQQAAAAAAPQAAAGGASPNSWQQTLGMLANPGHVTTPGATVPQAQSSTGVQPGVLQSFLANWQPQQSGPGSGFTQNFNTILRGLQAQKAS